MFVKNYKIKPKESKSLWEKENNQSCARFNAPGKATVQSNELKKKREKDVFYKIRIWETQTCTKDLPEKSSKGR